MSSAGEQLVQLGADRRLRVRVERGERLVEEEHLPGRARARARARRAAARRRRARRDAPTREVRDAEPLEVVVGRVPARVLDVLRARSCAGRGRSPGRRARRVAAPAAAWMPRRRVEPAPRRRRRSARPAGSTARRRRAGPSSSPRRTDRRARASTPTSRLSSRSKDRRATVTWSSDERCHESPMRRPARRTMLKRTSTPPIASVASKSWSNSA